MQWIAPIAVVAVEFLLWLLVWREMRHYSVAKNSCAPWFLGSLAGAPGAIVAVFTLTVNTHPTPWLILVVPPIICAAVGLQLLEYAINPRHKHNPNHAETPEQRMNKQGWDPD